VDEALAAYEAARRPPVTRIQDAARPSLSWWEHFGRSYEHLPPWQFAFHFFSRSLPESKLRQRDAGFVESVHAAWRGAHGGSDVLSTPIVVAGAAQPHRIVPITGGTARLAAGPLPLRAEPPRAHPWALRVSAPDTEAGLDEAERAVARGLAAGACLVAVGDGTALTRRLLGEAARLGHGAVTMLVEEESEAGAIEAGAIEDSAIEDRARTAVLSGRADLVGVPG